MRSLPPSLVAVDWSSRRSKRSVYVSRPSGRWTIRRQPAPRSGWTLGSVLELGRRLGRGDRAVLIGIDAVLGVPTAFADAVWRKDFLSTLAWLHDAGALDRVCERADDWSPQTPFFRAAKGKGGLTRFYDAAGGRRTMLRSIELMTGAKPVFCLSGIPGTVGSGSRELWRELAPLVRQTREFRLWPFECNLDELARDPGLVLGEVYPRAAYTVALSELIPAAALRVAKTQARSRGIAIERLQQARWLDRSQVTLGDLDHAVADEDDFDALLTAAALTRLVAESMPLATDGVDPVAEGGILGTGGIDFRRSR